MSNKSTSRRSILLGAAIVPIAAGAALASAAPMSAGLAQAIELHRVAQAAVDAASGPEDLPDNLVDAESQALDELAETPCANVPDFLEKLRYLTAHEKRMWGGPPKIKSEFSAVAVAVDRFLNALV